jgi:hypothetical protein
LIPVLPVEVIQRPHLALHVVALKSPSGALLVLKTGARSDHQNCVRTKSGTEIYVFAIRDALETLVKSVPSDHIGTKTHKSAPEPVNPNRLVVPSAVSIPVHVLAFIVERTPEKNGAPQSREPPRAAIVGYNSRNTCNLSMRSIGA